MPREVLFIALVFVLLILWKNAENKTDPAKIEFTTPPTLSSFQEGPVFPWAPDPYVAARGPGRVVFVFADAPPREITSLPREVVDRWAWVFVPPSHRKVWEESLSMNIPNRSIMLANLNIDSGDLELIEYQGKIHHPIPSEASFFP